MAYEPGTDRGLARFTLKGANAFLLADALGEIEAPDSGLFRDDTRTLSRLQLQWGAHRSELRARAAARHCRADARDA